jgi:aminoglycoside 6'-N-acetyltransferase
VPGPELVLRPLGRDDFGLVVSWLAEPHVAQWWGAPLTLAGVEKEFGPCIDGVDPTQVYIVSADGAALGLVQIYRLADNPDYERAVGVDDAAGVDLLVGEAERLGHGVGPAIIRAAVELIWQRYGDVRYAMAGPSVRNTRSHRAFEKAGFEALRQVTVPGEDEDEVVLVCPRPTAT